MASLEQFKQLETNPEKQSALCSEYIVDPEATRAKLIKMAADKGFELTSEEINQFISQMDEDDQFSDLELSTEAFKAVGLAVMMWMVVSEVVESIELWDQTVNCFSVKQLTVGRVGQLRVSGLEVGTAPPTA